MVGVVDQQVVAGYIKDVSSRGNGDATETLRMRLRHFQQKGVGILRQFYCNFIDF